MAAVSGPFHLSQSATQFMASSFAAVLAAAVVWGFAKLVGVATPEDVGHFFPRGADMFGINVRGSASIRQFFANPRVLRAIRTFNLTPMNRERNAYQASHCYSVADYMLAD